MTKPDPSRLLEIGMGFMASKTVLSAVDLGLFTVLGDRAMTGEELRRDLQLHPRAIPDFTDALVALGFLERDGDGTAARYRNTALTATFLDRNKPSYLGGILEMSNDRLYPFWGGLSTALKTGIQQNESAHGQKPLFDVLYQDEARLEQFIAAMAAISGPNVDALAEKFDFSRYKTLCDVGGASGRLAIAVARRHPHMSCLSVDLPVVEPIAQRAIKKAGLEARVKTGLCDFFAAPLPKADVITMGLILHDWDLPKKMHLIRAAYEALPKGGAFIVVENLIDDARRSNVFGLMMSLNMLIETGTGFDYSGADFAGWCKEVGFTKCETMHLAGPASAGIAYK